MLKLSINKIILCFSAIHFILALFIPLGNDEVYYVQYGRYPSYHYYDHPLMIGWVIKIFSFNFLFQGPFWYRIFSIISSAVSTYLVYKTALLFGSRKSAILASVLFSSSFYFGIIAGVFAMPDAPMILFWSLSLYLASTIFFSEKSKWLSSESLLIWFGLSVGLTILCKFHGAYLWVGILLFISLKRRDFFLKWQLYAAMLITSLFLIPIIYWNAQNDWVNFSFYSNRVGLSDHIGFQYFIREILGEIFYQNPFVWFFLLFQLIRNNSNVNFDQKKEFLFLMSVPLLFAFWALSLSRETLPHWSGPAYLPIIILVSTGINRDLIKPNLERWMKISVSIYLIVLLLGVILINYYPGTFGNKKDELHYGSGDFTLDMYGWKESGKKIQHFIKINHLQGTPLVSSAWFPAAHINEYVSVGAADLKSFAIGPINDIHQFHWINRLNGGIPETDSIIYITTSNYFKDPHHLYDVYFKNIKLLNKIEEKRSGIKTRYYFLYLLSKRSNETKLLQ